MSAEVPRNTGTGEPSRLQRPEGGISRFFKRLFAVPSASMQPPPELSDFAARLRQGIIDVTNELDIARTQAELGRFEREKQEAIRVAKEKEIERQQRQKFTESRLQALGEIKDIATALRIRERLVYINSTLWEGKGQIRDISTPAESATERFLSDSGDHDLRALEAGYELIYSYEVPVKERKDHHYNPKNPQSFLVGYSWRYITGRENTSLKVSIGYSDSDGTSMNGLWPYVGKSGKYINVSSEYLKSRYINKASYPWYGPQYEAEWLPLVGLNPPDRDGVEKELEQLLISESTERVRAEAIPSKLFLVGQERLKQAKSDPQWHKWEYVHTHFPESG